MDQRFLLAIALSMAVMIGYYLIFPPAMPPRPPAEAEKGEPSAPTGPAAPAPREPPAGGAPAPPVQSAATARPEPTARPEAAAPAPPAAQAPPPGRLERRRITVETPLYRAVLDNRGGRATGFELKRYKVAKENIDWGDLLPFLRQWFKKPELNAEAQVNLAREAQSGADLFGVSLQGEDSLSRQLRATTYAVDRPERRIDAGPGGPPQTLTMTANAPGGLEVRKTFTFHPDDYIIGYRLAVINRGESPRTLRVVGWFGEGPEIEDQFVGVGGHLGPIWLNRGDSDPDTEDADDIEGSLRIPDPQWLGIMDNYFITAVTADSPISHGMFTAQPSPEGEDAPWISAQALEFNQATLQPGEQVAADFRMYMGPKKVSEMRKYGGELETSLNLNLDLLARPMLALMRWFHGYTGNYGLAIILLTIVVRVVLFPLTYRGMLSIKRMQKLQPRMKALRAKYKKDKERLNKEMIGLYRKHKLNPVGGCLPIALQIPIFFALYSALLGAIELRHEPFMLWITDLSAQDGLYITPILMGGSMLLQQKMSPASLDPTQARIMMWMPVVFTFFMLSFPSGLVVYWLTSNVLSIGQQAIINRIKVPEPED